MKYSDYSNTVSATTFEHETIVLVSADRYTSKPSDALILLINTTIKGLKDDGVWALADAMYIRGVHESKFALQNWIKNAHNSTLHGTTSPVFTPKIGFTGDGVDKYIDNHYTPSSEAQNLSLTSLSTVVMMPYLGTLNIRGFFGAYNSGATKKYLYMLYYSAANERAYLSTGTYNGNVNIAVGEYLGYTRTGTTTQGYINGATSGATTAGTNTELVDYSVYELAINTDGTAGSFTNGQVGFSFYGGYLTSDKMLALYNRIKYFYDNVGGTF